MPAVLLILPAVRLDDFTVCIPAFLLTVRTTRNIYMASLKGVGTFPN